MNIGFDAKRAFNNFSGLGNYSRHVIDALMHSFTDNKYFLFTPSTGLAYKNWLGEERKQARVIEPNSFPGTVFRSWWRSSGIIRSLVKNRVDTYHGLSNELPSGISKRGIKSVVTIHDVIFKRHPEFYHATDRKIYDWKTARACEEADAIIAISEQTKEDLAEYYHVDKERIKIIPNIVGDGFYKSPNPETIIFAKKKFQLPDKFILHVGTVERRKNLLALLQAFGKIKDKTNAEVVLSGRVTSYKTKLDEFISKNHLEKRVHFIENISNEELVSVYQSAALLVYPSVYEGFGLPVAEALAAGVPVIANDLPVLREAGGPSSVYINMDDHAKAGDEMLNVLGNSLLREKMIAEGKKIVERFRSNLIAKELMKCYKGVVDLH